MHRITTIATVQAIILFSHGSVLCGAEQNLLAIAAAMRVASDSPIVEVGFLNYTEPSFAAAVGRCIEQGASRIVVAPYFLIAGKFVVEDLAGCIAAEQARHPAIEFRTAAVMGFDPLFAGAILASAENARPEGEWDEPIASAGASCRQNPRCPLYGTASCRIPAAVPA